MGQDDRPLNHPEGRPGDKPVGAPQAPEPELRVQACRRNRTDGVDGTATWVTPFDVVAPAAVPGPLLFTITHPGLNHIHVVRADRPSAVMSDVYWSIQNGRGVYQFSQSHGKYELVVGVSSAKDTPPQVDGAFL